MTAEVKPGLVLMQQLFPREGETQPRHRFPEFQHAGNWEKGTLGSVCDLYQPVTLSSSELSMTGEHLVYGANGIIGTHNEYNHEDSEVAVTCRGATCGEVTITEPKSWITGNAMVVKPKTMKIRKDFIFHYFKNHGLKNVISGSAQPQITRAGFAPLVFFFPPPSEQQRIAECLSSADEAIAAQARKVDALKKHKKGLMQQLFPREGDTQPHRRFPEFQNAGEWRRERLQEVTDSVFDGTHQTPAYTAEGVPFYSVENLISGNANKFISRSDYILATKKNKPTKGDILLTRIGKIGYSRVVTWDHDFSVYVTLAVIKQSKLFNSHYMSCFIQSEFYQSELRRKSLPDAVPPKINLDNLRSTTVLLPNEDEQRKLADCFTALDHLIIAETQKAEALKRHKRGLMQQLFPLAEEAKG